MVITLWCCRLVNLLGDVGASQELLSEIIITLGSFAHGAWDGVPTGMCC